MALAPAIFLVIIAIIVLPLLQPQLASSVASLEKLGRYVIPVNLPGKGPKDTWGSAPKLPGVALGAEQMMKFLQRRTSLLWHKADISRLSSNVCYWG
jgi:hypothetical protein